MRIKKCTQCNIEKAISEFHKHKNRKDGFCECCKECSLKKHKLYYIKNKDELVIKVKKYYQNHKKEKKEYDKIYQIKNEAKRSEQKKWYHLKKTYKITERQYNDMFNKQSGYCAICGTHQSKLNHTLHIDHNHKTKKIRGLLCYKCNHALGLINESPKLCDKLKQYIIKNRRRMS